jgi:hypothetical protein
MPTNPATRARAQKWQRHHIELVRRLFAAVLAADRASFDQEWADAHLDSDPVQRKAVAALSLRMAYRALRLRSRELKSPAAVERETLATLAAPGFAFVDLVELATVRRVLRIFNHDEPMWTETDIDRVTAATWVILGATTLQRTSSWWKTWTQRFDVVIKVLRMRRIGFVPPSVSVPPDGSDS